MAKMKILTSEQLDEEQNNSSVSTDTNNSDISVDTNKSNTSENSSDNTNVFDPTFGADLKVTKEDLANAETEQKKKEKGEKLLSKGVQSTERKEWYNMTDEQQKENYEKYMPYLNEEDKAFYDKNQKAFENKKNEEKKDTVYWAEKTPLKIPGVVKSEKVEEDYKKEQKAIETANGDNKPTDKTEKGGALPSKQEEKEIVNSGDTKDLRKLLGLYKNYLHTGIIRDYKNGLFGDINTPEGKKDAKALATYYVVNRIGTFLANLSNGYFGRPIVNSAYKELLTEQQKALNELGVKRASEATNRAIAYDYSELTEDERRNLIEGSALRGVYNNIDINDTTTAARWLKDPMLRSFTEKVSAVDDANVRKALLENKQLQALIEQIRTNTNLTDTQIDKVEEEIIRLAKENKFINAEKFMGLVNAGTSSANDLVEMVSKFILPKGAK